MRRSASALTSSFKEIEMDSSSKPPKLPLRIASHSSNSLTLPFLPHPTQLPPRPTSGLKPYNSSNGRLGCFCTVFFLVICFALKLWF
ncbi:hypothetical protein GOP47_0001661 [Adiantum capillus-veneris]|uniref:Uncharacterized protein n=1 Tax=Adiantum capillus-veneris TaxID=13818 RepID=A0A9D4VA50_ADICA|nr:hypothetical protein GOP47_0001661 [Adiantum capillus-veneris]